MVFFHQVYLTEIRGWDLSLFAGSTPVLSVFAIAATFAAGWLIDRFNSTVLLPAMLVFLALANLTLGMVASPVAILVYMACIGTAFGMYAPIFGAVWAELYGTRHLGAIKSSVTALMVLGTALSPGISGWLIDLGVGLPAMIVATGIYAAGAALLAIGFSRTATARIAAG